MFIEVIVCNVSVVFLRHSVQCVYIVCTAIHYYASPYGEGA